MSIMKLQAKDKTECWSYELIHKEKVKEESKQFQFQITSPPDTLLYAQDTSGLIKTHMMCQNN